MYFISIHSPPQPSTWTHTLNITKAFLILLLASWSLRSCLSTAPSTVLVASRQFSETVFARAAKNCLDYFQPHFEIQPYDDYLIHSSFWARITAAPLIWASPCLPGEPQIFFPFCPQITGTRQMDPVSNTNLFLTGVSSSPLTLTCSTLSPYILLRQAIFHPTWAGPT